MSSATGSQKTGAINLAFYNLWSLKILTKQRKKQRPLFHLQGTIPDSDEKKG